MNIYFYIISAIIVLLITTIIAKIQIPLLKGEKGHKIFDLAPKSHQKKSGTPSFGGIIFLVPILFIPFILNFVQAKSSNIGIVLSILIATFGFAAIGFIDDFIKFKKKHNDGFSFLAKFIAQVIISIVIILIISHFNLMPTTIKVWFFNINVNFITFLLFMIFYFAGAANATNFTDGLDGLLASNGVITSLTFLIIAFLQGNMLLVAINFIFIISLIGFLFFNWYPAKTFMGDTGSMAIGGFFAINAILLNVSFLFIIFGFVYIFETLSVSIQMTYFKYTKRKYGQGKRIFPMTPIHHSFEKALDWKETKIVATFMTTTLFLSIISILIYLVGGR